MYKKIIIGFLLASLAVMAGMFFSLPYFINKNSLKTEFVASFKSLTGFDIDIAGDVVVKPLPAPHMVINSMYVHNAPGASTPFLLTIKLVEIWPKYNTLLSKRIAISRIDISDVDIELERMKNGQTNWKDSSVQTSAPGGISHLSSDTSGLVGATVRLNNGYLQYIDAGTNTSVEYKDITAELLNGGKAESTMKLDLTYKDKNLDISGNIGNIQHALSVGEMPANLIIRSGRSNLVYEGNAGYKDDKPVINGSVKLETDDMGSWINTLASSGTEKVASIIPGAAYKPLPLKAKSDITSDNGKIIFPNLTLDGALIKGVTRVELSLPYDVSVAGTINMFDLETLSEGKFVTKEKKDEAEDALMKGTHISRDSSFIIMPKTFFSLLNLNADLKFENILYNAKSITDAHIGLDSSNGEMTISQASATLPGDSRLVFAGIGKEGYQGFTLEGELDAAGADFSEAIKLLKGNGAAIPTQDFKRFRLKANVILSSKELRMSELAARIENMAFMGGFIAAFGDRVKLNAAMRVGGVNLDHFLQIWGIEEWRTSLLDSGPESRHDSFLARWLRRLDYDVSMNVAFEDFILRGYQREKADFKLTATDGKVALDDIRTAYNGSGITGRFLLDVTGTLPKIEMKAEFDTFDEDTFFTPDGKPEAQSQPQSQTGTAPRWSRQTFDFHWLDLIGLSFNLKFDNYKQGGVVAQGLVAQGGVEDRAFTVDSITGTALGARFAGKGSIKGGKIPAININMDIGGLDPTQLLPYLPVLSGMTGKYNLSLRLNTSGIDMASWVSSLQGAVGVGGEHVNIHGFNLSGVIHAVNYVRTVADILNVVRRAFPGGDTMFSSIEGQWAVANGVLKTSNSRLVNEQATGILTSQIDLVNWQMQSVISLKLTTLDAAHPPGMIISFNGSMDQPDISLDTRSLEQYVTNKTSERMLNEYGTGPQ